MIQKSEVIPLLLVSCPGFRPLWDKHRELWEGEEAGIYNDLGEFATFIVDAYERQNLDAVAAAFAAIEQLLDEGEKEVRTAATIGFLEDIQNISSHRPFGAAVFVQWLGPKSKAAWAEIEEAWRGKSSLADVVRAEISAEKSKKNS